MLIHQLRPAFLLLAFLTAFTGLIYPLAATGLAALLFPYQSHGSLLRDSSGKTLGSELIGQWFDDPRYFWPRPSATSPEPYNAASSSGSNQGPLSGELLKGIQARRAALRNAGPEEPGPPPLDLLTSSASGLDPHISPAAAAFQIARVARARGLERGAVAALAAAATEGRQWGLLGEPRVNVLKLNLSLDRMK